MVTEQAYRPNGDWFAEQVYRPNVDWFAEQAYRPNVGWTVLMLSIWECL